MCLGLVGRVVELVEGQPDVAIIELAGVRRPVNIGLLDEPACVEPGVWVLVHMGFALQTMTDEEAAEALRTLDTFSAEREPEAVPWAQ